VQLLARLVPYFQARSNSDIIIVMQPAPRQAPLPPSRLLRGPALAVYLMVVGLFGILVPFQKGLGFLDPVILTAYACLGAVFAGPVAVQLFERVPASVGEALRRVLGAFLLGEAIVVLLLALGLGTVRLTHRGIFPLDAAALAGGIVLGAALSLALSGMAAWIRTSYSATVATSALRGVLLALLIAFLFRSRWLPDVAWMGAGIALAAAAVFTGLLAKRVHG